MSDASVKSVRGGRVERLFIHPDLRDDPYLLFRSLILVYVLLFLLLEHSVFFLLMLLSPLSDEAARSALPVNISSLAAAALCLFLIRHYKQYVITCLIVILQAFIALVYGIYTTGGPFYSPAAQLMILPCMMSLFFLGMRWGVLVTVASFLAIVCMMVLQLGGLSFPKMIDPRLEDFINSAVSLATYLIVSGLAYAYAYSSNELKKLRDAEYNKFLNLANTDPLTGLANRRVFDDTLEDRIALYSREVPKKQFALCYIDLNNFKPINDDYGHDIGDEVLSEIASRLHAALRGSDFVGRYGGDEFLLIFDDVKSEADCSGLCNKLLQRLRQDISTQAGALCVDASAGFALFPTDAMTAQQLRAKAEAAMYEMKESSKSDQNPTSSKQGTTTG